MQHVYPDVCVGLVRIAQTQQKTNGVQVPLKFFHLDTALAECVTHQHVHHDHAEQHQPYVRQPPAQRFEAAIDDPGDRCMRQRIAVTHQKSRGRYARDFQCA